MSGRMKKLLGDAKQQAIRPEQEYKPEQPKVPSRGGLQTTARIDKGLPILLAPLGQKRDQNYALIQFV